MTTQRSIKKTFSLPQHVADRLDTIASHTGYNLSNLVLQALTLYMHRYEQEGSLESWLEHQGRTSGLTDSEVVDN